MKTIDIIHDEHRALAAVLQALRFVVGEIRAGKLQPDFRLLYSMIDYIALAPEKVHHPKEDKHLFPMLRIRSEKAEALIDQLEREHAVGYRMTAQLRQVIENYERAGNAGFAAFDVLMQQYLDYNWKHLQQEEAELLPLAREVLSPEDWAEVDAAFSENFDPYAGTEGEFKALFSRIVNMTPAPYGLGPEV